LRIPSKLKVCDAVPRTDIRTCTDTPLARRRGLALPEGASRYLHEQQFLETVAQHAPRLEEPELERAVRTMFDVLEAGSKKKPRDVSNLH
jgi:hypothetical protein